MALFPRQTAAPGSNQSGGSNSLSGMVSTLIPLLLIATAITTAFLVLRTKHNRVYSPRGLNTIVPQKKTTPFTSTGMFGWVPGFRSLADNYVLNHNSLDGYLFLRFFKVLIFTCFAGCILTWPILFPVNATGGGGESGLDAISFSNVAKKNYFYAHALVSWVFLGFVMLVVARERIFFVGLRQAYFFTPFHAQRLSARVVLFCSVPVGMLTEAAIRETFGPTVRKVWLAYDSKKDKLDEKVQDRDKLTNKLEGAQMKMITQANKNRLDAAKKAEKSGHTDPEAEGADNSTKWLDEKKRPTHRLKFLIGKKVDTENYAREELPKWNIEIQKLQQSHLDGTAEKVTAVFVEFSSQVAAQDAYESVAKKFPSKQMSPRCIGMEPEEVIWKNLGKSYMSRKLIMAAATTFVALLIIFWTIPVAIVGTISNINCEYILFKFVKDFKAVDGVLPYYGMPPSKLVPFLSFINDIPPVILGVVTGLLPSVMLAVLVALVPIIFRLLAKFGGAPTLAAVEIQTQKWYFWFQIIQVFLVTTFTSGASSVVAQIVSKPTTATSLLAKNLPKASNFYISFFIVYALGQAPMMLLSIAPLLFIWILGPFLDKTPRKLYKRWISLNGLGWGSEYPKWTNLGVIAFAYSCIAPLVLGFATIGLSILYFAFRYNWLFVIGNKIDMKGESYPLALHQLLGGVYLSCFCLIGLFAIAKAWGPMALMIIFLVAAAIFQIAYEKGLKPLETVSRPADWKDNINATQVNQQYAAEEGQGSTTQIREKTIVNEGATETGTNGQQLQANTEKAVTAPEAQKGNFLTKFLAPHVHAMYEKAKPMMDGQDDIFEYTQEDVDEAYMDPAVTSQTPLIWLAKDSMGLSKKMVTGNKGVGLDSSDDAAWLNDKNKVEWTRDEVEKAPIWERKVYY